MPGGNRRSPGPGTRLADTAAGPGRRASPNPRRSAWPHMRRWSRPTSAPCRPRSRAAPEARAGGAARPPRRTHPCRGEPRTDRPSARSLGLGADNATASPALSRGPHGVDTTEPEGSGRVLVEVPGPSGHVGPAVINHGMDRPPAVGEANRGPAWKAQVRHAVVGVKATGSAAPVVIPRGHGLAVDGERHGRTPGGGIGAVASESDPQALLFRTLRAVAQRERSAPPGASLSQADPTA